MSFLVEALFLFHEFYRCMKYQYFVTFPAFLLNSNIAAL